MNDLPFSVYAVLYAVQFTTSHQQTTGSTLIRLK